MTSRCRCAPLQQAAFATHRAMCACATAKLPSAAALGSPPIERDRGRRAMAQVACFGSFGVRALRYAVITVHAIGAMPCLRHARAVSSSSGEVACRAFERAEFALGWIQCSRASLDAGRWVWQVPPEVDSLVLLDRDLDLVSPLLTQMTYEGTPFPSHSFLPPSPPALALRV